MLDRMADVISFTLNDHPVEVAGVSPMTTLLDYLREHRALRGTKEGCAEGDCGACTIVLERADGRREAVNSCILMLGQVDGLSVRSVEGLSSAGGAAHPVQTAMADADATQCGFCTPGFVMSAFAYACDGSPRDTDTIHEALAGNLCRCTGYRPIVEALRGIPQLPAETPRLPVPRPQAAAFAGTFFAPRSLGELLSLRSTRRNAVLLAGGTDLGLLAGHKRLPPEEIIHLAHVPELAVLDVDATRVNIGAAVTYTRAMPALTSAFPALQPYLSRLGSRQIRNLGTIGGNVGNASPIGDMPPVLLALGATLTLASTRGTRDVALDEFFLGYRKTALGKDEVIVKLALPRLGADETFFCDKVSKRRDQDISTVAAAYRLRIRDGRVVEARIGFGGMAATPVRAVGIEKALVEEGFDAAVAAVPQEFQPIDDWRGSGGYRVRVAANLLRRLELRLAQPAYPLEVEAL